MARQESDTKKLGEWQEQLGVQTETAIKSLEQRKESEQNQTQLYEENSTVKNPIETVIINGQQYTVEYVPKEEIYPAFGYSDGNKAVIRQDLSPRVKKFVKAHELYHCQDKSNWGGWWGQEIRANIVPGLKDPLGLLATVWATISNLERIKFYLKRAKERE